MQLLIMNVVVYYMAYCWSMHFHLSMSPTKAETGLLQGMRKLNDFSSYSYVYMYWSCP